MAGGTPIEPHNQMARRFGRAPDPCRWMNQGSGGRVGSAHTERRSARSRFARPTSSRSPSAAFSSAFRCNHAPIAPQKATAPLAGTCDRVQSASDDCDSGWSARSAASEGGGSSRAAGIVCSAAAGIGVGLPGAERIASASSFASKPRRMRCCRGQDGRSTSRWQLGTSPPRPTPPVLIGWKARRPSPRSVLPQWSGRCPEKPAEPKIDVLTVRRIKDTVTRGG
jgi:hypothetical protein